MSGGSHNYAYYRVRDMAEDIRLTKGTPLRRAFARHLELVAEAMKAVEWVDSCDSTDDSKEIRAVLGPHAELEELIAMAKEVKAQLDAALAGAEGEGR